MRAWLLLLALLAAQPCAAQEASDDSVVTVLAPSNLSIKLSRLIRHYTAATGTTVSAQFASSSELAQRINDGEPADLFISADREWLNYIRQRGLTDVFSETRLLSDPVVLASAAALSPLSPPLFRSEAEIAAYFNDPAHAGETVHIPNPETSYYGSFMQAALGASPAWPLIALRLSPAYDLAAAQAAALRDGSWVLTLQSVAANDARLRIGYRFGSGVEYYGVVVAGENMPRARALLESIAGSDLAALPY